MNKSILFLLVFCLSFPVSTWAQETKSTEDPDLASFEWEEMMEKMEENGRPWLSVMSGENILTGIYKLKAGAEDEQSPHKTDEVYYVVSGKGKFRVGEKEIEVKTGSILFVKANAVHQFFDITEDLVMVVFFDK